MSIARVIADLQRDTGFMANVTAWETLPARPARWADPPAALHPALSAALARRGIERLYSHQAEAVSCALEGHSVAVVTPTASGKTLCYNLPVLHALLNDPTATALYLFPTKALAHDQLAGIEDWMSDVEQNTAPALPPQHPTPNTHYPLPFSTYDGDTPAAQRTAIRRSARLLLTNPDMLHAGILPFHGGWERFFAGLRFVVIDEMHVYRGVFGSHVANVLRRLARVAAHYGSQPQFVLTSATIANPQQLAETLTEQPVTVIDGNGAPQGEKQIVLYSPPLYDPARGLRRSSVLESQALAVRFLLGGLQTIVFGRARLTVEILLTYIRDRLRKLPAASNPQADIAPHRAIRGYRGGYLPEERRAIEAGLRDGSVRGVVATNALELGIDIGQLQAALLCGYPGTIAGTWQQWGRVGRTTEASLAVLVATAGALDQFVVNHPEFLLARSPEHAFANPDNLMLLVDQMRCAAFELPFAAGDSFGQSPHTAAVLALLAEEGAVQQFGPRFLWSGDSYPARQVSLRSVGGDPVVIQAVDPASHSPEIIGEVDAASAQLLVHDGAVYIHEGQSYLVERLELDTHQAWVRPAQVDFYTEAGTETDIQVLATHENCVRGGAQPGYGDLLVTSRVTEYRRVRRFSHENLGIFPLEYPPSTLDTAGYWLGVTPEAQVALMQAGQWRDSPNEYGPNWQEQRRRVRARDGYCCAECGAPEPQNRQHDVHHLVPFRTFGYIPGLNENYQQANRLSNLLLLCRRCHQRLEAGVRTRSGLDGLAYALGNLAPLHLMCDRRDIGVAVIREERGEGESRANDPPSALHTAPRIYIYERIPAGLGFSAGLYERHDGLMAGARELIRGCGCAHGCPACVGPVLLLGEEEQPVMETKRLVLALLDVLIAGPEGAGPALAEEADLWFG